MNIVIYWSRGNKVQRILLHVYFHNHDIGTYMNRQKYKNIIKRSHNPLRKIMKQFVNIRHNVEMKTITYCGVCHESLLYGVISNLHHVEES